MNIYDAIKRAREHGACITRPGMSPNTRICVVDTKYGWLVVDGIGPSTRFHTRWLAKPEDLLAEDWEVIDKLGKVYLTE